MEDARILALYFARKEEALTQTEAHYGAYCRRIAMGILHSEHDAEECVNDAFYQAWNAIPPQKPVYFGAFLGKITRNVALNRLESRHAQKRGEPALSLEQLSELGECIPDHEDSPADALALKNAVQEFVGGLTPEQRCIFLKRYWYCCSVSEIAEDCGCTKSKVKTTLFRLREKLRHTLEQHDIYVEKG